MKIEEGERASRDRPREQRRAYRSLEGQLEEHVPRL